MEKENDCHHSILVKNTTLKTLHMTVSWDTKDTCTHMPIIFPYLKFESHMSSCKRNSETSENEVCEKMIKDEKRLISLQKYF